MVPPYLTLAWHEFRVVHKIIAQAKVFLTFCLFLVPS